MQLWWHDDVFCLHFTVLHCRLVPSVMGAEREQWCFTAFYSGCPTEMESVEYSPLILCQ